MSAPPRPDPATLHGAAAILQEDGYDYSAGVVRQAAAWQEHLERELESCQAAYNRLCRDSAELAEEMADRVG